MYGSTSWHQGRPDQRTQVCDSSRMAWNGGRGETEWPISPAGNPFLPREALQMPISKDCETLCLRPFFDLLHAVFCTRPVDLVSHMLLKLRGKPREEFLRLFVLSKLGSKNWREFFSVVMILSTVYPNAKWWIHPPQNTTLLDVLGRYIGDQDWISLQQVVILTQRWWQSH